MVLMQEELSRLKNAIDAHARRKSRKRRYIRTEETLTVGEVDDLVAEREHGCGEDSETPAKRVRKQSTVGVVVRKDTILAPVRQK
jgi:hypothetical protein